MLTIDLESQPFLKSYIESNRYSLSKPYDNVERGQYSLTAGVLRGPDLIQESPVALILKDEEIEKSGRCDIVVAYHLGSRLCGHKGIIHGGMIATLLDEILCRCAFTVLPHHIGVTASLDLQYLSPTLAESVVYVIAETTKLEGRKCWVDGKVVVVNDEGVETITATAKALVVEPKWAAKLASNSASEQPPVSG